MKETVHLPIVRYKTPHGKPTCATSFEKGEICTFLASVGLKAIDVCVYAEIRDSGTGRMPGGVLNRDTSTDGAKGMGYLLPHKLCPVWSAQSVIKPWPLQSR